MCVCVRFFPFWLISSRGLEGSGRALADLQVLSLEQRILRETEVKADDVMMGPGATCGINRKDIAYRLMFGLMRLNHIRRATQLEGSARSNMLPFLGGWAGGRGYHAGALWSLS